MPKDTLLPITDYDLNTVSPEAIADAKRIVEQELNKANSMLLSVHGDAFCNWKDRQRDVMRIKRFLDTFKEAD